MPDKSIFHRIVTKEDSYTQLLCNTLKREPSLLGDLLEKAEIKLRDPIKSEDIRTQVRLNGCGTADLLIQTDKLSVIFEVKTDQHRPLEETQKLDVNRQGYKHWLEDKKAKEKYEAGLVYLVPGNWEYRTDNANSIESYKKNSKRLAINACQIYWDDVLQCLQKNDSRTRDPIIVEEFRLLLMERFGPINFSTEENKRMFTPEFQMETVIKLNAVLEGLRARVAKKESESVSASYEFGFYLKKGKRDLLFVGLSKECWDAGHHQPICFGVDNKDLRVKEAFIKAFRIEYKKDPISIDAMGWTMGWVTQEDFNRFVTADAINEIWNNLGHIWESVKQVQ
jgi:hypothetical protein